jgi:hypothetical protein
VTTASAPVGRLAAQDRRAIAVDDRRHRVQLQHHAESAADLADRVDDRGGEHPDGEDDLEQVFHVAEEQVGHRDEQPDARGEDHLDQ